MSRRRPARDGQEDAAGPGAAYGIVGRSPAIRDLVWRIEQVGPTEATVLVLGERGTGKELVARALARASRRRDRPFVAVNCAALPAELLAAELFGHERGAFTGATERRPGLLQTAHGGTVFLDEIGDLSAPGQAMLLRVLQEREVRPLGSSQSHAADVRVLAATNRDLEADCLDGRFRPDLFDRLCEFVLRVPPLRERAADVPLLLDHFLACAGRRDALPAPRLDAPTRSRLVRHSWPGNVRELQVAVRRAAVFGGAFDQLVGAAAARRRQDAGVEDTGVAAEPAPAAADRAVEHGLSRRQRDILRLARTRGALVRGDVVRALGGCGERARRDLLTLVGAGHLVRTGRRRSTRYAPAVVDSGLVAPDQEARTARQRSSRSARPSASPIARAWARWRSAAGMSPRRCATSAPT